MKQKESNYLEKELSELIEKDSRIFAFLQNSAMDGLWYWDLENPENEWMNERFWEVLGYDPAEMPHKAAAWQDKIDVNDLNTAIENFNEHLKDPTFPYDQVVRYRHKNGSIVWIRCRGMILRDGEGRAYRMLGSHNDVTELKELELKYKLIAENTSDGIFTTNSDRIVTFVSSSFLNLLGYNEEEFLNKSVDELNRIVHPDDRTKFLSEINKAVNSNESKIIAEIRVRKKDGTYIWHEEHISFTYDSNNNLSAAYAVCRDITERKAVEAELLETKRRLKLQLDYILNPDSSVDDFALTDIIDTALLQAMQDRFSEATGVAAVIVDPKGNLITRPVGLSEFCSQVRNTDKGSDMCRKSDSLIGAHAAAEQRVVIEACPQCGIRYAGAPISIGGKVVGTWIICQGKMNILEQRQIFDYAVSIGVDSESLFKAYEAEESFPSEKFDSIVNLLSVFVNEISSCAYNNIQLARKVEEQAEYEKTLIRAKIQAEESDKLKTAFLSNISHEIRTPLNGMLGFIDLLSESDCTCADKIRYNELIHQSSARLVDTINNIIELSLIETNQVAVQKNRFSITKLLGKLASEYRPTASERKLFLSIDSDSAADKDLISTDEEKLYEILSKLLDNAFKYTREGGVTLGYKFKDSELCFFVKDTGIGISPRKMESIFNRFEQAELDYTRSFEGTGIGLSIATAYAALLGGRIFVDSRVENPSEGIPGWSEFAFLLPVY